MYWDITDQCFPSRPSRNPHRQSTFLLYREPGRTWMVWGSLRTGLGNTALDILSDLAPIKGSDACHMIAHEMGRVS